MQPNLPPSNVIQFPYKQTGQLALVPPRNAKGDDIGAMEACSDHVPVGISCGDYVIYDRRYTLPNTRSVMVIRIHSTGEHVLKRVSRSGKKIVLHSVSEYNSEKAFPASDIEICGKVIGIQRPFED